MKDYFTINTGHISAPTLNDIRYVIEDAIARLMPMGHVTNVEITQHHNNYQEINVRVQLVNNNYYGYPSYITIEDDQTREHRMLSEEYAKPDVAESRKVEIMAKLLGSRKDE